MSLRVHGIAACDTCRKARRWLTEQDIDFDWVDLRADGIDAARVRDWLKRVEPARLLNRRSTTWRQLPEDQRPAPDDPELAGFLATHPTLIKRPVFERDDGVVVGFGDDARAWLARS
jgi:arsenate reductase